MLSDQTIRNRVAARRDASALTALIRELIDATPEEARQVLFETLREGVDAWQADHLLAQEVESLRQKLRNPTPMNDAECEQFGNTAMPFGKFAGQPIHSVELRYLEWLAFAPDEFKLSLQRYLLNPLVEASLTSQILGCGSMEGTVHVR